MRRRDLLAAFGVALTAPVGPALAQAAGGKRRIGALFSQAEGDTEGAARLTAFRQGLRSLGWREPDNLAIDARWSGGNTERMQAQAASLVARAPEVVLASATTALAALRRATSTVPIVFAQVSDPVGAGFIQSLAHPGGNITGLTQHEFAICGKWLELLKQAVPRLARVGVLQQPSNPASEGYLRAMAPAAQSLDLKLQPLAIEERADIVRAIPAFAQGGGGGLVLLPGSAGSTNRALVIALCDYHMLPAIYAFRYHVLSGGLMSYGIDNLELYRRAAWYVDRILKGARPGDLPVEHASKFQFVINLRAAAALGLNIPLAMLTSADEVIE